MSENLIPETLVINLTQEEYIKLNIYMYKNNETDIKIQILNLLSAILKKPHVIDKVIEIKLEKPKKYFKVIKIKKDTTKFYNLMKDLSNINKNLFFRQIITYLDNIGQIEF
jgi:hypothetical protein